MGIRSLAEAADCAYSRRSHRTRIAERACDRRTTVLVRGTYCVRARWAWVWTVRGIAYRSNTSLGLSACAPVRVYVYNCAAGIVRSPVPYCEDFRAASPPTTRCQFELELVLFGNSKPR